MIFQTVDVQQETFTLHNWHQPMTNVKDMAYERRRPSRRPEWIKISQPRGETYLNLKNLTAATIKRLGYRGLWCRQWSHQ